MVVTEIKNVEKEVTIDYLCNLCGESFIKVSGTINAGTHILFYCTKKHFGNERYYEDNMYICFDLCEKCCKDLLLKFKIMPEETELSDEDDYTPGIDFYV